MDIHQEAIIMNQVRDDGGLEKEGNTLKVESFSLGPEYILKVEPVELNCQSLFGVWKKNWGQDDQNDLGFEQLKVCSCHLQRWKKYLQGNICVLEMSSLAMDISCFIFLLDSWIYLGNIGF